VKVDPKRRNQEGGLRSVGGCQSATPVKDPRPREPSQLVRSTSEVPGRATIGARVRYEDEDTAENRVITLVYPNLANVRLGRVSVLDPLGMALLGLREGESVDWPMQHGARRRVRLVKVLRSRSHSRRGP